MKTKYIKVSVSERLPKKFGHYMTFNKNDQRGYNYFDDDLNDFRCEIEITSWLEEVTDREDEVIYVLETLQRETMLSDEGSLMVEQLLNELKQTT